MEKKLVIFLFSIFMISYCYCEGYNENKSRLESIKTEIEKKNRELEEYNKKYEKLLMDLKKLKDNEKNISEKKKKLDLMIENIKEDIKNTKEKQEMLKNEYFRLLNEMNNDISSLYLSRFSNSYFYSTSDLIKDMIKRNIIIYKSNYAKAIDSKTKIFSNNLMKLSISKERYSKEVINIKKELESNRKGIKQSQKELYLTDARVKELKSEIDELNRTARNLSSLIKKIEKNAPYKKIIKPMVLLEKKSLQWPCEGIVIKKYGKEYIEELKTWVINDGIKIKTSSTSDVKAVLPGRVLYSGEFRGFGNIVIIGHENNLFSTYGFLSEIFVSTLTTVNAGTVIGKTGRDMRDLKIEGSVLYFELRKGDVALNPLEYLK